MIKALSFAAVLALSTAVPAFAQDDDDKPSVAEICQSEPEALDLDEDLSELEDMDSPSVRELETAARSFGERMKAFDAEARGVCGDAALSDDERQARVDALWARYQPDVDAFVALAARLGPAIAAEALAGVDIEAITAEAMAEVNASGEMQGAMGVARNSAWTSGDPEHMATLGLAASYALGEAMDEIDEAQAEADAAKKSVAAPSGE